MILGVPLFLETPIWSKVIPATMVFTSHRWAALQELSVGGGSPSPAEFPYSGAQSLADSLLNGSHFRVSQEIPPKVQLNY